MAEIIFDSTNPVVQVQPTYRYLGVVGLITNKSAELFFPQTNMNTIMMRRVCSNCIKSERTSPLKIVYRFIRFVLDHWAEVLKNCLRIANGIVQEPYL